jgi:methylglutaconyl-CoA hydratase
VADVLRVERDDRDVVTLTFARPEARNAFDAALTAAALDAVSGFAADPSVRVLVLTGAGSIFSAGADLHWMAVQDGGEDGDRDGDGGGPQRFERLLQAVDDFPAPVVARINGHALAGAGGLVACADIAVAVSSAAFGFPEVRLGLIPAMIAPYVQPRIGRAHATRYFLTGARFDAAEALAIGLIHRVCATDALDDAVEQTVTDLLFGSPLAQRQAKRLVRAVAATTRPEETTVLRHALLAEARASADAQERISAFLSR